MDLALSRGRGHNHNLRIYFIINKTWILVLLVEIPSSYIGLVVSCVAVRSLSIDCPLLSTHYPCSRFLLVMAFVSDVFRQLSFPVPDIATPSYVVSVVVLALCDYISIPRFLFSSSNFTNYLMKFVDFLLLFFSLRILNLRRVKD